MDTDRVGQRLEVVTQGSVLGSLLFTTIIDDIDDEVLCEIA